MFLLKDQTWTEVWKNKPRTRLESSKATKFEFNKLDTKLGCKLYALLKAQIEARRSAWFEVRNKALGNPSII